MTETEVRTYKGVNIWPADTNGSGIRWTATVNGTRLRADTLAGIRHAITTHLELWGGYSR